MTKASVDYIFKLKLPNLPPRTLDGVDLASHCAHTVLIRRERDGVVCGSFADADVMVARKHKTKLIVEVCADVLLLEHGLRRQQGSAQAGDIERIVQLEDGLGGTVHAVFVAHITSRNAKND
eukprot:5133643-Pleurochrysis_carterae.AAC.1